MKLINYFCIGTFLGLVLFASMANAEDECGAAVDSADSMNMNQKECDYTDKGLNGVLHKAFKQGDEGAVLETKSDQQQLAVGIAAAQADKVTADRQYLLLRVEVDQWSSVTLARTQLFPKAMEKCTKGFSVQRENYRPLAMGRIELSIEFSCFE